MSPPHDLITMRQRHLRWLGHVVWGMVISPRIFFTANSIQRRVELADPNYAMKTSTSVTWQASISLHSSAQPRRHGDCFGGLSPPNKAPSPLKSERETLLISGVLVNFIMSSPPPHKRKAPRRTAEPPIENFLATVLVLLPIATDGVPLWVTNIDCRLQTTQKKNWEAPSSSSSTTGWAIVCGVWAKKAGNHWSIWIG